MHSTHVHYAVLFLLVSGGFCIGPPLRTWVANNTAPLARRATAIALMITATNAGTLFASSLFGAISPAPEYGAATVTLLAFQIATIVCVSAIMLWLRAQNITRGKVREQAMLEAVPPESVREGDEIVVKK